MILESEQVLIDTNVLIYSTFEDFEPEKHVRCLEILNELDQSGSQLFVSSQVLREFYAIATNDRIFPKPLTSKQALRKIKEFVVKFSLVMEKETTLHVLLSLIEQYAISCQKIHDMNIVAAMMDNGISHLFTYNIKDFRQIREIQLLKL
ncbi:MAG: PIN domain-containing protein [Pseudomonadota bacterium]